MYIISQLSCTQFQSANAPKHVQIQMPTGKGHPKPTQPGPKGPRKSKEVVSYACFWGHSTLFQPQKGLAYSE